MTETFTTLGLESSCDDTAAAVVRQIAGQRPQILSSVVMGQQNLHADFGGIVPEIAARAHAERLDLAVEKALEKARVALDDIDLVAVTSGPGLIGGLVSGVMSARAIASARGLPVIGVNHLAGHALSPMLAEELEFPYLLLLVSGGHCQFLLVRGVGVYQRLGGTIDDAPGEAFDKVAKLLGLPQPGGPEVEKQALQGDPTRFALPRPLLDREGMDMSFSGLKTAVLRERDRLVALDGGLTTQNRADVCASFQAAVRDVLVAKSARAISAYLALLPDRPAFCVAGGVASNSTLRRAFSDLSGENGCVFVAPPMHLCTDNAAMIAWTGMMQFQREGADPENLIPRARWPLDPNSAPMLGSGKKGAKA